MKHLIQRLLGNYLAFCALKRVETSGDTRANPLTIEQRREALLLTCSTNQIDSSNQSLSKDLADHFVRSSSADRTHLLSPNAALGGEGSLAIDVTQTVSYPYNTGIQRVTRETLRPLRSHFKQLIPYRIPTQATHAVLLKKLETDFLFDFHPLKRSIGSVVIALLEVASDMIRLSIRKMVLILFEWSLREREMQHLELHLREAFLKPRKHILCRILSFAFNDVILITNGATCFSCEFVSADNHFRFYDQRIDSWMRVFFVVHDLLPLEQPESFDGKPEFSRFLGLVNRGSGAICESKTTFESLKRWRQNFSIEAVNKPTICAYLGQSFSGAKTKGHSRPEVIKAICVGTFEPRKNQLRILLAVGRLWQQGVKLKIHFVGNPGWRSSELFAAKAALDPNNDFSAVDIAISDATLEARYAECDFFIQSSLGEGFGLPALEALAHGLPGIISNGGSLAEINAITKGCIEVDPMSELEIEEALRRICDDVTRNKLKAEIQNVESFSWDSFCSRIHDFIAGERT
ncbi:MAG: glycosyltransferase [Proteobacteria bacterium]|nr:MAG: glycosyltransferase [Pseudomonadota bacterium]